MLPTRALSVLLVLTVGPAAAQPATVGTSNDEARAMLERALEAHGGSSRVLAAQRLEVAAEGAFFAPDQSRSADEPIAKVPRRDHYIIDADASRARLDSELCFAGGLCTLTRTVVDGEAGFSIDLLGWRLGTDVDRLDGAAAETVLATLQRFLPHLLLRQALQREAELRVRRDGERLELSYPAGADTEVVLRLDPRSSLVLGYTVLRGGQNVGEAEFSEFRSLAGLQVPSRRVVRLGGVVREDVRIDGVLIDPQLPDSLFVLPQGYRDRPPATGPRALELAPGVYLLDGMPGDYRAAFVELPDGVAVLEAPHSAAFTEAARSIIAQTLPGKPVRYVLVTHHHSDHVAGVAGYLDDGVTVFVPAGSQDAIRRQLGAAGETARIESVSGVLRLGRGPQRIDAHLLSSAHAEANLAFHLPEHGILFQGDLFYLPERGELPAALPMTEALDRLIRERRLNVRTLVGVHGRSATLAELREALRKQQTANAP